jgi:hypothetical protein
MQCFAGGISGQFAAECHYLSLKQHKNAASNRMRQTA